MKVFCDACGTKYSIADDRIAGRAFKLRCKNCDHLIIKRAPSAPVAEPSAAPADWHVVIDGAHRPIAVVELHQLRAAGQLDDAALVWREGFDGWRELGTIDELRVTAPSIEAAPEAAPAVPPAGAHPVLRNERNETSVLFSLGKLATLAAPARAAAAPAAGGEGSGLLDIRSIARTLAPAVTHARTERAGLDDLPVYGPMMFAEPAVFPRPPRGRDRRLVWALAASSGMLAIATAILVVIMMRDHGSAHAGVLPATPRAAPMPAQPAHPAMPAEPSARSGSATANPPAAPGAASPGAATAASPGAPTTSAAAWPGAPDASAAAHATAQAGAPTPPPVRSATVAAAPRRASAHASVPPVGSVQPAPSVASGQHAGSMQPVGSAVQPVASAQPIGSAAQPVASAQPVGSLQPRRATESCSEVTCIVNGYADPCCAIYRTRDDRHVAPAPDPALPDSLDLPAIVAGLARIDTRGCRDRSAAHGDVTVSIKVSPAGAVAAVAIKSSPDPALGACVDAAARKGRFAPTQRGGSFAYVWRF